MVHLFTDNFVPSDVLQPLPPDGSRSEEQVKQYDPDQTPPYNTVPQRGPDKNIPVSFQVDSNRVHMKVRVTENNEEPFDLVQREGDKVMKVREKADGSIEVSVSFDEEKNTEDKQSEDKQSEDKESEQKPTDGKSKPDLNQIYNDLMKTLNEKTNFQELSNKDEYMTVIARFLESSHLGKGLVDESSKAIIETLASELFRKSRETKQSHDVKSSEEQVHYASAKDFSESAESQLPSSSSLKSNSFDNIPGDSWVRVDAQGKSNHYGATVDENGVLILVENSQTSTKEQDGLENPEQGSVQNDKHVLTQNREVDSVCNGEQEIIDKSESLTSSSKKLSQTFSDEETDHVKTKVNVIENDLTERSDEQIVSDDVVRTRQYTSSHSTQSSTDSSNSQEYKDEL